MEKIEISRLIKLYDFLKADLEYKSNLNSKYKFEFDKVVSDIIEEKHDIKEFFKNNTEIPINEDVKLKSDISKKLFREIVKKTHPDITNNKSLNEDYIMAAESYQSGNLCDIIILCDKLNINYDLSDDDLSTISTEIRNKENDIMIIENSIYWRWFNSKSKKDKDKVILQFLKSKIY